MIPIDEYVARYARSRTTDVTDVLLRSLPEAIALWRSVPGTPAAPLRKSMVMVDEETGIVEIAGGNTAANAAPPSEGDDVRAFGEIVAELLQQMPYNNHRVARLVRDCRDGRYATLGEVMLAVEKRRSSTLYIFIIAVIALLIALLALLNHHAIEQ